MSRKGRKGAWDGRDRHPLSCGVLPDVTAALAASEPVIEFLSFEDMAADGRSISQSLHQEEVDRARSWSAFIGALSFISLFFVPFLGVPGTPRNLFAASLCVLVLVSGWVQFRCRGLQGYTPVVFRVFGYTALVISLIVEWYLGVFSPTALVVTLGITFFGLGMDRLHAVCICGLAVGGYLVLCLLTTLQIIPEAPVMQGGQYNVVAKVYFTFVGPFVMLGSLWMAGVSRRSMDDAIERAIGAMNLAGEKDAQLVEAQQDIRLLLEAGKGQPGRYTGRKAGEFMLGFIIGRGGMGDVYYAQEERFGREAAVKVLRRDALGLDRSLKRFLQEGDIAGRLRSRNIVRVFEVGVVECNVPYISMELLKGEELASRLRREGRLSLADAMEMIEQVALGLDEAHRAGVVHRDLKPQNIFYCEAQGVWKILDFGISKYISSSTPLTGDGNIVGTPGFMAPEQAIGAEADFRADVFALGAVAYRCITGRQAFLGPDAPAVMFEIVYRDPPASSSVCVGLPEEVDAVLFKAMEKDPSRRFQSAIAFAAALRGATNESEHDATAESARLSEVQDMAPSGQVAGEAEEHGSWVQRAEFDNESNDTIVTVKRRASR